MLRALYAIAIGLLFVGVVGFGFAAFYPAPTYPERSPQLVEFDRSMTDTSQDSTRIELEKEFEQQQKEYEEAMNKYNRNLSVMLIAVAMLTIAVSILGLGKLEVIGDGLTLGGILTLLYGLGRAVAGGDEKIRFLAVAFGLVVIIFLSYWKFIRKEEVK